MQARRLRYRRDGVFGAAVADPENARCSARTVGGTTEERSAGGDRGQAPSHSKFAARFVAWVTAIEADTHREGTHGYRCAQPILRLFYGTTDAATIVSNVGSKIVIE